MKTSINRLLVALAVCILATGALAYDQSADTAGPLTVSVRQVAAGIYGQGGMMELSPEVPWPVGVMLQNSSDETIRVTLRVQVIDRWRVEPSEPQGFTVEGKGRRQVTFMVTAAEGSYNAHYPIHAFAEFEYQGHKEVAHPIFVLETRFPNPPRPVSPLEWKPVPAPAKGTMGLWRVPVHREEASIEVVRMVGAGSQETYLTDANVLYGVRVNRGGWRAAVEMGVGMRPPSLRERVDMSLVEYPLELPKAPGIQLSFANAISDRSGKAAEGVPDAVTFRVRAIRFDAPRGELGKVLFERRTDAKAWQEGKVDLSPFGGQMVRLQLESASEPANSRSRQAYWGEPTLVVGEAVAPAPFPPTAGAPSRLLGTVERQGRQYQVRIWPGRRGALDAAIGFESGQVRLQFRGFRIRVLGDQLEDNRSGSALLGVKEEPAAGGRYRVRHRFSNWVGNFDVVSEMWVERGALWTRFLLENAPAPRPWLAVYLEDVGAGPWSEPLKRIYFGPGNVIQDPGAFRMNFGGHNLSTSFVGLDFAGGLSLVQGVDVVPNNVEVDPEARICTLNTAHNPTLAFIPTANVWDGVKVWRDVNGLKAAGGVAKKAGRFVFDMWGGRYEESAKNFAQAFRYGLTDSLVVWHRWQRWGYDYRLPDIYPPDPKLGTLEEFRELVNTCKRNGVLFGPHDNYVDFYADAEGFTYDNIAFLDDGRPRKAWINGGRDAQSYRPRADRLRPFLERNARLLREGFGPTAYFIDVWTSTNPHDYWTKDGQFFDRTFTRRAWGEAYAWLRDFMGENAPTISEAGHDQLIGWFDGADAQVLRVEAPPAEGFVWPIKCADSERTPWYDAAHHDRFILHGAGYGDRYVSGLDSRSHGMYSDDYIATEVLTGHPAMVALPFGRDVVRKYWLLHDMMRALALRRIEGVDYSGGNLHRQQVRWDNGAEVWVNRDSSDWTVAGHVLPQYGYRVRIPVEGGTIESAIERRDGVIVEWTTSPSLTYVNARPVVFDPDLRQGFGMRDRGPDPRPERMNPAGKPIAFGAVTTSGGFRLMRAGEALEVTPLPNSPAFTARLRWKELPWQLAEPKEAEALNESGQVIRRVALAKEGAEVVLACEPGVFSYRLR